MWRECGVERGGAIKIKDSLASLILATMELINYVGFYPNLITWHYDIVFMCLSPARTILRNFIKCIMKVLPP
jgi:hypothetical protein